MEHGREEAFNTTCCDYGKDGERQPDMNRCERIRWARAFIENCGCNRLNAESAKECSYGRLLTKGHSRVKMLLEDEQYLVVLGRGGRNTASR